MLVYVFHISALVACLLYAISSSLYVNSLNARGTDRVTKSERLAKASLCCALFFHIVFVVFLVLVEPEKGISALLSFPSTLTLMSLFLITLFLSLESRFRLTFLGALVSPLAFCLLLGASIVFHMSHEGEELAGLDVFLTTHWLSLVGANVLLGFAFSVSVAIVIQEWNLRRKRFGVVQQKLPPLVVMDSLQSRFLALGFFLLLIGVSSGFAVAGDRGATFSEIDPRLLTTAATTIVYGLAIGGQLFSGWHGLRSAWLSIVGFSTVIVSFFAVNLFGSSFHSF